MYDFKSDTFSVPSSSAISDIQVGEQLETVPVVNDKNECASLKKYKITENNTEDSLQKDGSSILTSRFSNIEDENKSNMDKGLTYATFDETGAVVSRTSHVKKCNENFRPAENLRSESLIQDLSSDGTKKINGENSQLCNHHKNFIDSISKVKHKQDQNLTQIFKQQDSMDVPDLEFLTSSHPLI